MNEEKIKEAFAKAKQDISTLTIELSSIKQEIQELKELIQQTNQQTNTPAHNKTETPNHSTQKTAQNTENSTIQHIITASSTYPAHNPADILPLEALKTQNRNISIRNEGVPADRQTNQQTDNSTRNEGVKVRLNQEVASLRNVKEVVNSLDNIKKELRSTFKKLTNQEMSVFATIYQLEDQGFTVDYFQIAKRLNLTESSIRDYIQRIIKKGIPIIKTKENNKKIILSISQELKKLASLSTLLELREI